MPAVKVKAKAWQPRARLNCRIRSRKSKASSASAGRSQNKIAGIASGGQHSLHRRGSASTPYSSSLGRNVLIVVAPLHFCRDVYAGAREMPYYSTMHLQRGDIDMVQVVQYSSTGTERGMLHSIYCQDQPGTPTN